MARKKLSAHAQSLWRWARPQIEKLMERDAARHPVSSLAAKMYRMREPQLPHKERGAISPLGGVATVKGRKR
jgi:hypothetical protein